MDVYQITINYNGVDVPVVVNSLEEAANLLNDHDAAIKYVEQNYTQPSTQLFTEVDDSGTENICEMIETSITTDKDSCNESAEAGSSKHSDTADDAEMLWTRKKPTEKDLVATKLLLSLREKLDSQFNDKKSLKSKLWTRIASQLQKNNFNLGINGGERCRQKFANLTKAYLNYLKHQKTTGTGKQDDIPPFFDEIHSIMGSKHKVNPTHLEDTREEQSNQESSQEDEQNVANVQDKPETKPAIENRFRSVKKTLKPKTRLDSVLEIMKEDQKLRSQQVDKLAEYLKRSEEQKERFLNILEKSLSKKRKRDILDSDSD